MIPAGQRCEWCGSVEGLEDCACGPPEMDMARKEIARLRAENAILQSRNASFEKRGGPGPYTPAWISEVDLAVLKRDLESALAALRETAQCIDADKQPCWCQLPVMIPYRGHDGGCRKARTVLKIPGGRP